MRWYHMTRAWPNAIRQIGVNEVTLYRWRQKFGGL
jgi:transposase-like protein